VNSLFADTSFWIAILNPRDFLHRTAVERAASLPDARLVTSEMVLAELLNDFASRGEALRSAAARFVEGLLANPDVTVVVQSSAQFREALTLYGQRPDKTWALTDCSSAIIMSERNLHQALTHDHHFEQMGFEALLRS